MSYVRPVPEDGWEMCPTPDCENKVCLWSGLSVCYPCGVRLVGQADMDRRYAITRISATNLGWNGQVAPLQAPFNPLDHEQSR